MTYYVEYSDPETGDLQDRDYACGRLCAADIAERGDADGLAVDYFEYHGHEQDADTYCGSCGTLLALGLSTERYACDWSCVPVVVSRGRTDTTEVCEHGEPVQVATLDRAEAGNASALALVWCLVTLAAAVPLLVAAHARVSALVEAVGTVQV